MLKTGSGSGHASPLPHGEDEDGGEDEDCAEALDGREGGAEQHDGENHGREGLGSAEDGGDGDGGVGDEGRDALRQHDAADDLHWGSAHALRRFNDVGVQLAQTGFDQARDERERRDHERHDSCGRTDNGADDEAREREDEDHQDQEGDGAEQVDDHVQHAENPLRDAQDAVMFARDEQHAERQADHHGEERGEDRDIDRLPDRERELMDQNVDRLEELFRLEILKHGRPPPLQKCPECCADSPWRAAIPCRRRGCRAAYCRRPFRRCPWWRHRGCWP